MKCGYCGYEFPEEEGIKGCGKCGMPGRCHMVRCPRCFYENPPEVKLFKKIRKLMDGKKQKS
jgi:predicted amidophosphoribosyltransferase